MGGWEGRERWRGDIAQLAKWMEVRMKLVLAGALETSTVAYYRIEWAV